MNYLGSLGEKAKPILDTLPDTILAISLPTVLKNTGILTETDMNALVTTLNRYLRHVSQQPVSLAQLREIAGRVEIDTTIYDMRTSEPYMGVGLAAFLQRGLRRERPE
jgi:hypothetical protein